MLLILGVNFATDSSANPAVAGFWASPTIAIGAYAFVIAIPRLYAAYVDVNKVSDEVNGYARRRR